MALLLPVCFGVDIMGFHHRRKQEKERVAPCKHLPQTAQHRRRNHGQIIAFFPRDLVKASPNDRKEF